MLRAEAALPAVPVVNQLPGIKKSGGALPDLTLTRHDVPIDRAHVAAYSEVCGFPVKDTVPVTYPHVLAFGLHMAIMTDPAFPAPAIGTVHLENSITQHRPIAVTEKLQVTAHPERLRPHAKGQVFDMVTRVHSRGELVWEETSTFLRRGPGSEQADPGPAYPDAPPEVAQWALPARLGRRYAAVSGDRNPIHVSARAARLLGFPRAIAHGMWTKARALAALEPTLPDAFTVDVRFKLPLFLPAQVAFGVRDESFDVHDAKRWTANLTGAISSSA